MTKPKIEQESSKSNFDQMLDRAKKLADTIVAMSLALKVLIGVISTLALAIYLFFPVATPMPPNLEKDKETIDFRVSIENNKRPQVISIIVGSPEAPPH